MWNCKTLKIQRTFQNWSKILEVQKSFNTYKWGTCIGCVKKSYNLLYKIKKIIIIIFWLWFKIVIISKDETWNLQGIATISKEFIYSKIINKKSCHVLGKLNAFIITNCKKNCSKIHLYEKLICGQKDYT
jgi:hypothetical protein